MKAMAKDKKGVSKIAKAIERSPGATRRVPFSVVQQDRRTADPETGQGASRQQHSVPPPRNNLLLWQLVEQ
jgi:hypothetical protein